MAVTKRIVLRFPKRLVERPIVYHLVKDYDLEFNILKASITPEQEGLMILELKGNRAEYDKGIGYLIKAGVKIESLSEEVTRNEDRCTSCGACITVCPTGAFRTDPATREVLFDNEKCIACGLCIPACPPRAMEVHF
ncbi:MAG: 4Fe-4S binding protein [Dehalococcoidales bacterium]|nr:4Fe-4S binding protein [Dehalococcoidales bacterium]